MKNYIRKKQQRITIENLPEAEPEQIRVTCWNAEDGTVTDIHEGHIMSVLNQVIENVLPESKYRVRKTKK